MNKTLFTSESVTEGHPDKVCDQIADAILDDIFTEDPSAHTAIEVCATTGMVMVFGEVTTEHYADIPTIVRGVLKDIGYNDSALGFDYKTCAVLSSIQEQSPDIAQGVNHASDSDGDVYDLRGAGDQGMMFGYATDETEELMPLPIVLAHKLTARLTEVRKSGEIEWLRPDGKAQVTVEYEDDVPSRVDTVVVSCQHADYISKEEIEREIIDKVINVAIPEEFLDDDTKIYINPTGRFVIGGPAGDSGLTGRKIIVDTYGGFCPHGGGSFSGKDPTKVDRSACYMANLRQYVRNRRCERRYNLKDSERSLRFQTSCHHQQPPPRYAYLQGYFQLRSLWKKRLCVGRDGQSGRDKARTRKIQFLNKQETNDRRRLACRLYNKQETKFA